MRWLVAVFALACVIDTPTRAADTPLPWDQAEHHVGETATVEGRVLGVHCSPTSCLLAFDPTFNRFTAVVQAERFRTFPPDTLDEAYSGRIVRVRGKIVTRDKKPEIIVDAREQLEVVESEDEKRAAAEAPQVEALERMATALERIDGVMTRLEQTATRLAEVQDRLMQVLAALEERTTALAAMPPVPVAPPPATGDPQPRPAFEALRHIKRGMTRSEIARLIGDPETVEAAANGWTTWYYGYDRSITFDARGRAQAFSGFE